MEQASLRLMRGLQARGHRVSLLSLNPIGKLGPLLEDAGIPHEGLPYRGKGGWRGYASLKRKLGTIQADGLIMTGHHLLASIALGDFCRGHRLLAVHFHHAGVKPRWQWRLIYRLAARRFTAVTFPCDFIRREAESIFPPIARLAHTIVNPLDVSSVPTGQDRAKARDFLGLPRGSLVVGNAGWLIPRKRFDVFLHVAQEVLARIPNAVFLIAGDGPERKALESLVCGLGISASMRWLGWCQEMASFYKSLDVLLFNSDWDALPTTPLEAMSFGVPVVCSVLHGGLNEIIDSARYGYVRSTHDVKVLAGVVLQLLKHPQQATAMGLAARNRIEQICRTEPIVEWHERALLGQAVNGC